MANPSQPTNVNVGALKKVLANLQSIQQDIGEPPAGTFDEVGETIQPDLMGMQGNAASVAGQRYSDSVKYVNYAWRDVTTGVATLVSMVEQTIAKHQGADDSATQGAQRTNTTQQPTSGLGKD